MIFNQIKINIHSLHAKVLEFYISEHFTSKCKARVRSCFNNWIYEILEYLRNSTDEDIDIYCLEYTWLFY